MAIDFSKINGGDISLMANFGYYGDRPLDARQVVPALDGIQTLIDNDAAYAGMVTYVTSEERLYEIYDNEGILSYRPLTYTQAELNEIVGQVATAAMEFKGAAAALPENPAKGDMYKVAGENIDITIDGVAAKLGDSVVYDGEKWFLIPSGDDIEDTWRAITGVDNAATLSFVNGNNTTAEVKATGEVTFHHNKLTAAPADITTPDDLVDADGNRIRTYLTAVEVDEYGHVTNYKTATENVEDTDTTYTFECQVEEGHSNVYFSVKASDAEHAQEVCLDAYTRNETDAAIKVVSDIIDNNKATWDLAGTAVQSSDFNTFKNENTQAIADAVAPKLEAETFNAYIDGKAMSDADLKKYADDAAGAVDAKLTNYSNAHASDYTNEQIDKAIEDATGALGTMSTKDAGDYFTKEETAAKIESYAYATDVKAQKYASDAEAKAAELDAALKSELQGVINGVDAKFDAYVTNAKYAEDKLAENAIDADHESRIAAVEAKFNDGEGSVADQIATAVAAEAAIARAAEKANADDIDALEGRMSTAEGKISNIEGELANKIDEERYLENLATLEGIDIEYHNRITALEDKFKGENSVDNQAKAYTDAEVSKEKERALAAEEALSKSIEGVNELATLNEGAIVELSEVSHSHGNKSVLDGITAEKVSAWDAAESNAKDETEKQVKALAETVYTQDEVNTLIAAAKKYADDNDADTKYGITYDSTNKKIKLVEGGTEAEIDASAFIKDGMISDVTLGTDNDLVITFNTDAGKENIVLPLDQLVDIYTGSEGTRVNVAVSNENKISADLVAGSITKNYLDTNVQASLNKADSALQAHQDISHLAKTEDLGKLAYADNITAAKVTDFAVEVAKIKVDNAVHADSATEAGHAASADYATKAGHATTADSATEAGHAATANQADEADHAATAEYATEAGHATAADHADAAGKVDKALTVKVGGEDVVFDGAAEKTADIDAAIANAITAALTWGEF